jgi:cell division protein FtsN
MQKKLLIAAAGVIVLAVIIALIMVSGGEKQEPSTPQQADQAIEAEEKVDEDLTKLLQQRDAARGGMTPGIEEEAEQSPEVMTEEQRQAELLKMQAELEAKFEERLSEANEIRLQRREEYRQKMGQE